jgi:hypothetical protein
MQNKMYGHVIKLDLYELFVWGTVTKDELHHAIEQ